jgi:hypothetical protein
MKSASLRNNLEGRLISPPNVPIRGPGQEYLMPTTLVRMLLPRGNIHEASMVGQVPLLSRNDSNPARRGNVPT